MVGPFLWYCLWVHNAFGVDGFVPIRKRVRPALGVTQNARRELPRTSNGELNRGVIRTEFLHGRYGHFRLGLAVLDVLVVREGLEQDLVRPVRVPPGAPGEISGSPSTTNDPV